MSSSILPTFGAFSVLGVEAVVVMVVALGLFVAVAAALCQPTPGPHAVVLVDEEPLGRDQRPLSLAFVFSRWRSRRRRPGAEQAVGQRPAAGAAEPARLPVIGYATFSGRAGKESEEELDKQAEVIARACDQRGLALLEVVGDPHTDRRLVGPRSREETRPGLGYALGRIAAGEAGGLVVPGLRRLTRSVAELGPIVERCMRHEARLVAVAQGFDTGEREGRVAARLIIEVSRWEREGLWEPAREGLFASPSDSPSAVASDEPDMANRSGGESS
jgi:hypothetical protein